MSSLPKPVSGVGFLIFKKVSELLCWWMWYQECTRKQTKKQESTIACLILAGNNYINQELYNTITGDLYNRKLHSLKFQKSGGVFCSHYLENEGGKWLQGYIAYMLILLIFSSKGKSSRNQKVSACHPKSQRIVTLHHWLKVECS